MNHARDMTVVATTNEGEVGNQSAHRSRFIDWDQVPDCDDMVWERT
jgi:hypothetical protein